MTTITRLTHADRARWAELWTGYLTFYKATLPPEQNDLTWQRLHDPAEPMHLLGAYVDGKLEGIVHYLFHRSTWTDGNYCYLQDLFVAEGGRNHGLGRALIEAVYAEARQKGASRVLKSRTGIPIPDGPAATPIATAIRLPSGAM